MRGASCPPGQPSIHPQVEGAGEPPTGAYQRAQGDRGPGAAGVIGPVTPSAGWASLGGLTLLPPWSASQQMMRIRVLAGSAAGPPRLRHSIGCGDDLRGWWCTGNPSTADGTGPAGSKCSINRCRFPARGWGGTHSSTPGTVERAPASCRARAQLRNGTVPTREGHRLPGQTHKLTGDKAQ